MSATDLRATWLVRKHEAKLLGLTYLSFTVVWSGIGLLLVNVLDDSSIVHADESMARWFADHRTPALDRWSAVGSKLADTEVKILVTAIVATWMLIRWKRWLEPLVVVAALVVEALTFITVTLIVGRPRPDVPMLEASTVDSSYPSGHVAAAVAYAAIIVVVFWHTRSFWVRALAVVLGVAAPLAVGWARMYRGMHHFSDVVMGVLLGLASVAAAAVIMRRADERSTTPADLGGLAKSPELVTVPRP